MDYTVRVFEAKRDAKAGEAPVEISGFAVSGETAEEARRAALARLGSEGRTVRALSFTLGGGIAAVVYAPAPPPPISPAPARRRRGAH